MVEEGWNGNCRDMKAGNGSGTSVEGNKGVWVNLKKAVDREGGLKQTCMGIM